MKYVKTFESFTSQINEEEEIFKSIRKAFGKETDADLAPLKEKFDAELASLEKQILANMVNPESPIKLHMDLFNEDENKAKKETTFNGVVSKIGNYKSEDYKERWGDTIHKQLLQVKYIQENGWYDENGKYSTAEEMKGKELEACKSVWNKLKPEIEKNAREEKYDGQFHKYIWGKLLFMSKKVANPQEFLEKEGKIYLFLNNEIFSQSQEAKGTYASGGFHR